MNNKIQIRKQIRDFEGRISLMKKTPLKELEDIFLELYEYNLQEYIRRQKQKNPEMTWKQIIIKMYRFHDELKNSGSERHIESL